jgi:uncharacterized protein YbjT (DUF2867 family)
MILITGATGNTGREVSRLLKDAGIAFKAMARSQQSQALLEEQGIETLHGDFDDPVSLQSALKGISRAYLVCTPDEKIVERELSFIKAAKAAGVGHIVKLSALMSAPDGPTPNHRAHGQIEDALVASGMVYTIIRPHGFFQTVYFMSKPLMDAQGIISYPAGSGRASHVDLRDVAAVAYLALTADGHENKKYDVTGPQAVSFAEMAEAFSKAMKKAIHYIPGDEGSMIGFLRMAGVAEQSIEHVIGVFRLMREGKIAFVTETLSELGIEPRTLEDFAVDLASGKTGIATSFKPPNAQDHARAN